ncbi:MAG: UBP-type zinc finger domain-containing protein [Acidimicrobiia bacterium]
MSRACTHIRARPTARLSGVGCVECLESGGSWVHLRACMECGHIGCCDESPNTHATKHFHETGHPVIRSFEPGEAWWYCYADDAFFEFEHVGPLRS